MTNRDAMTEDQAKEMLTLVVADATRKALGNAIDLCQRLAKMGFGASDCAESLRACLDEFEVQMGGGHGETATEEEA